MNDINPTAYAAMADCRTAPGWWRRPFRMMQTNLRLIDAALDAEAVADAVASHGADAWLLNTGGIYASYPSALPSQTPNPHLALRPSGDIVGDAVAAAHARGLKLLARMDFSKVLPRVAEQHLDWLYVSASGQHQVFNELFTTCPSAGYFQDEVFTILDEVLDRFEVDGFFINWFMYSEMNYAHEYLGPCHCDTCRGLWKAQVGGDLPTGRGDPAYPSWAAWSRQNVLDLGARIRAHIASHRPDTPLILHDTADIRYVEANNAVGREFWPHQTAESVSAAFTRAPDTPVLVNCVGFLDFPYRMAAEHPERFAQYLIQAMSRGAAISTYIMGPPGAIAYPLLGVAREITGFHRDHDALYAGLRPAAQVLLVGPDEYLERGPIPPQLGEFRGWYTALQELHVPIDVVEARHLSRVIGSTGLGRYRLLVLPDAAALDAISAGAVDDWVHAGGLVLATLSDGNDDAILPRSLGVEAMMSAPHGADLLSAYAKYDSGLVVPLHGCAHHVTPVPDARIRAHLMPPARFGPPEYCYGHIAGPHCALLEHQWGRGRSLTHTWSIGRAYHDLALADVLDAIARTITTLSDEMIVDTTLPGSAQLVAGRSGDHGIYHIVNMSGTRRSGFTEPVPIPPKRTLRVSDAASGRARALLAGCELGTRRDGDDLLIELPEIGRFEVVLWDEHPQRP